MCSERGANFSPCVAFLHGRRQASCQEPQQSIVLQAFEEDKPQSSPLPRTFPSPQQSSPGLRKGAALFEAGRQKHHIPRPA